MGKTCPKCGEYVSCKQWMYCDKMCRPCSGRMRRQGAKRIKQNESKNK